MLLFYVVYEAKRETDGCIGLKRINISVLVLGHLKMSNSLAAAHAGWGNRAL